MQMQDVTGLIARASSDAAIRAELVKDPRAALARAGAAVPADTSVDVFENDASTFHAVLPLPGNDAMMAAVRAANPTAAKVYERAWKDPAFKQRLLSNPRHAFVEATGVNPPASLRLVAHEDTPKQLHIVIPYVAPAGELSDADLEQVAGGKHHQSHKCQSNEATAGAVGADLTVDATMSGMAAGPEGAAAGFATGAVVTGLVVGGVALASSGK
jgi:hypothetical protein